MANLTPSFAKIAGVAQRWRQLRSVRRVEYDRRESISGIGARARKAREKAGFGLSLA
jgi:hypothetical protein